jgi:lipopolysaccharide biosynthesis regulator YciM
MDGFVHYFILLGSIAIGYAIAYLQFNFKKFHYSSQEKLKEKLKLLFHLDDDREISKLLKSLEVSKDTFGIHMAVGGHYRKSGEVEKAIGLHQNLLGHPEIPSHIYGEVALELAKDYMAAGLLDRAEALLLKIMEQKEYRVLAIPKLIDIYQQEKEWEKALKIVTSLDAKLVSSYHSRLAHFCCELAQLLIDRGEYYEAQQRIRASLDFDKGCVRAAFLLSDVNAKLKDFDSALINLKKVMHADEAYAFDVANTVLRCVALGLERGVALRFLQKMYQDYPKLGLIVGISELLGEMGREREAIDLLENHLKIFPRLFGLLQLVGFFQANFPLTTSKADVNERMLADIVEVCGRIRSEISLYKCLCCGFEAKSLYWLCPSCREWSSVKPVVDTPLLSKVAL